MSISFSRTYKLLLKSKHYIFLRINLYKPLSCCHQDMTEKMRRWLQPEGSSQLKLYNSLTKEKNAFIPHDENRVFWYSCGPTVYDASHIGHARSYISFDILRRVLADYFNYDIFYVMNITDIDDKIINRARRNHLMKQYKDLNHSIKKVTDDLKDALVAFKEKVDKNTDPDKKIMLEKILVDVTEQDSKIQKGLVDKFPETEIEALKKDLLTKANDPLSEWLDKQFGAEITDHKIFQSLTQYWEKEYHDDMAALNVQPADILTRVSQYVPENIAYIEKIISNGFAYESNGSVYFDTVKFANSEKHQYAKLVPEAVGDLDALAEGEGDLSQSSSGEKRSDRDFALWKASKAGEPFWESPWGKGRPGWHIECSVMASDVLGSTIDVHTGGVDLKFPHHDNELAQAEAHYGCDQWINYFLHAGHLTIEGCKMSKSLKNFITIKDALRRNTSRQIRFAFLLHAWNSTLDYSTNVLKEAEQTEKLFADFFLAVKDILRKPENVPLDAHNYREAEKSLQNSFLEKKKQIHNALCDSIDTATVIQLMQALAKQSNIYIKQVRQLEQTPNHAVLKGIAKYLTRILKIFGANDGEQEMGFPSVGGATGADREEMLMPFVDLIAEFREDVRKIAREEKVTKILKLCDDIRDDKLVELGVKLEDQEGGLAAVVKLVDKETLLKEKQQKLEEIEKKRKEKEEAKLKKQQEQAAKEAKAKIPASEMFRTETDKYSQFDENGVPTHDASGEKLSASQIKKLKKAHAQQDKIHQKYLSDQKN